MDLAELATTGHFVSGRPAGRAVGARSPCRRRPARVHLPGRPSFARREWLL